MAKNSTRVLSFILAALLLVTMLPAIALAEEVKYFKYDEAATTTPYYTKTNYDELVGTAYQADTPNVFVVCKEWAYKPGQAPETVKFTFRGKQVTEKYSASRHMSGFTALQKYLKDNAVKNPVIILTEGAYGESFKSINGFTILGPKAGMNPNVPNADPTKEWALSSKRKIPTDTEYFGEAVFRVEGGMGGAHLIEGSNNSVGTQNYIIDGVVFQGDGSGVADESSAGGGTRNWYVQNCIFDDCYSEGGRGNWSGLAFDQRSKQTYYKNLYVSNSYIINQNTKPLYSGHGSSVHFNGVSAQYCDKPIAYRFDCIQWQGQTTSITNCHFWNPKDYPRSTGATEGLYLKFQPTSYSNSGLGSDDAPFRYIVRNNSFYHVDITNAPLVRVSMAGNTSLNFEENIVISEEGKATRSPIQVDYIYVDGKLTHEGMCYEKQGDTSSIGDYELTNERLMIRNNTFVGKEFQAVADIGVNRHANTKVEQLGNLYLDTMESTQGKMIDPYVEGARVYNKWVWLDAARTQKSSEIVMEDINITCDGQPVDKSGYEITIPAGPKEYTKSLAVSCNTVKNSVRVYESDASWVKGNRVAGSGVYTLNTAARTSYYIVSIVSIDGRTELDYKITFNRAANPDAQLYNVLPQGEQEILSSSNDGITYNFDVAYSVKNFKFKLDTTAGTKVYVQDSNGILPADASGVYTTGDLEVGKEKSLIIHVIDQNGDGLREFFYLNLTRAANTETELLNVTTKQNTSIERQSNNTFVVTVPAGTAKLNLKGKLSDGARMDMIDPIYKMAVPYSNGEFIIDPVLGGENAYAVKVYSQDGEHEENWTILVVREMKTACKLLGIADTEKIGDMYVAYTANTKFMVSASVSEGATYRLYSDAKCTKPLSSARVSLSDATTVVWLKVFAEDESYSSDAVKILINTYADTTEKDETPAKLPMQNNGIIGVTGGQFDGKNVVVPLAPGTKAYTFRIQGYDNYVARVYTDATENPMRVANTADIALDSGRTILYATATKGSGASKKVVKYTITIIAPQTYKYTDKQTAWAAGYVKDIGNSGLGLMKGDEKGKFNGAKGLTRYEMAALMVRVAGANAGLYAGAKNPFSDAIADWALNYVKAAARMGMINGYEQTDEQGVKSYTYKGTQQAKRNEFFRVFTNAILGRDVDEYYAEKQAKIDAAVEKLKLKDLADVADWAKPAVYSAIYMKLVQGDTQKKINPVAEITRNEVAAILSRYYAK